MRRDSIIVTGVFIAMAAAIAATGYVMNLLETVGTEAGDGKTTWITFKPHPDQHASSARTVPDVPAGTSPGRTDTPIKCHDPEIGDYWTNAASCEGADLYNRISEAQTRPTTPAQDKYSGEDYRPPAEQANLNQ